MIFTSNPFLMLRQFVFLVFAAAGLIGLAMAGLFRLGMESIIPIYIVAGLVLVWCVLHVAVKGRVRVEITDDDVIITRPRKEELRLSRKEAVFSSRVVSHSVNLIPTETERILIVHDGEESREILLPNLSKKAFDSVMALLVRDRILSETPESGGAPEEARFVVPKAEMLRDFRRLIAIFIVLGLLLSAGLVGFIGYMIVKVNPDVPALPLLAKAAGFCLLMFVGFGVPVAMTYRKNVRGIPERVAIAGDALEIGEERFPLAHIRRVVLTPPEYAAGNFVDSRTAAVWTDYGKTVFNFGKRRRGGVWKTVFEEYGEMCGALERAAAQAGFELVYDL